MCFPKRARGVPADGKEGDVWGEGAADILEASKVSAALANSPKLLLADEPTGNLDPSTSEEVFEILVDLVRETKIGCLIATHNLDLADQMDRVLELKNGRVLPF